MWFNLYDFLGKEGPWEQFSGRVKVEHFYKGAAQGVFRVMELCCISTVLVTTRFYTRLKFIDLYINNNEGDDAKSIIWKYY